MSKTLDEMYERDRVVWDSCARTYESQIVGGHPDVTSYEAFEEELLDRVLYFLMRDEGLTLRLFDVGCGSARLHRRYGLKSTASTSLEEEDARRLRRLRELKTLCAYDPLYDQRLRWVEGLDFSAEMLQIAREKLDEAGLSTRLGEKLRLQEGSAFDMQAFPEDPVPVLVSVCNSIGVMQGPDGAVELLRSMRRAVEQARGIAIVSCYEKSAVGSFALGNYETTMDVCGQPVWLQPDTYAGDRWVQRPLGYKRAHDPNPEVRVDVFDKQGGSVASDHVLKRSMEAVAQAIESGHIQTHTDYESRWYSFHQFEDWIAEHWQGLHCYHLRGKQLDSLRAEPVQLAILDPARRLEGLLKRWL
jgi:SAM-dependent methyltransferase